MEIYTHQKVLSNCDSWSRNEANIEAGYQQGGRRVIKGGYKNENGELILKNINFESSNFQKVR